MSGLGQAHGQSWAGRATDSKAVPGVPTGRLQPGHPTAYPAPCGHPWEGAWWAGLASTAPWAPRPTLKPVTLCCPLSVGWDSADAPSHRPKGGTEVAPRWRVPPGRRLLCSHAGQEKGVLGPLGHLLVLPALMGPDCWCFKRSWAPTAAALALLLPGRSGPRMLPTRAPGCARPHAHPVGVPKHPSSVHR